MSRQQREQDPLDPENDIFWDPELLLIRIRIEWIRIQNPGKKHEKTLFLKIIFYFSSYIPFWRWKMSRQQREQDPLDPENDIFWDPELLLKRPPPPPPPPEPEEQQHYRLKPVNPAPQVSRDTEGTAIKYQICSMFIKVSEILDSLRSRYRIGARVKSRHLLKIQNGRHKQRGGHKIFTGTSISVRFYIRIHYGIGWRQVRIQTPLKNRKWVT